MTNSNRENIHEYYIKMTDLVASRSTSPHRKVGAVLVKDSRVIATGFNGAPKGLPHETKTSCPREKLKRQGKIQSGERYELCTEVHAEINAIIQCAIYGVSCKNAILYVSTVPCMLCARAIINARISAVFIKEDTLPTNGRKILEQAKIPIYNIAKSEHIATK